MVWLFFGGGTASHSSNVITTTDEEGSNSVNAAVAAFLFFILTIYLIYKLNLFNFKIMISYYLFLKINTTVYFSAPAEHSG